MLCDSTLTHNVDIGLLRMLLSLTHGRSETLTTTDMGTAFLNAPMDEIKVIPVSVPQILTKLVSYGQG
eukprot:12916043-Prorocentrum_lima.AAC.1